MIQFNLLPDVKLEYIKARRTKRMVIVIALMAGVFTFSIFALLFINVNVIQTRHLSNLTKEIQENTAKLEAIEDIDKVLTIQNQLKALTPLHETKPASERALSYVSQVTPQKASVSQIQVNFDEQKVTINGTTDTLVNVNKFVDTLKFTKYKTPDNPEQINAFSQVVLTSFSVAGDQVTYQIDFKYDPPIFDNTKTIELIIPNIISTRSETEKPSDNLFQEQPKIPEEG